MLFFFFFVKKRFFVVVVFLGAGVGNLGTGKQKFLYLADSLLPILSALVSLDRCAVQFLSNRLRNSS